jgi:hypothetical protein
MKLMIGFDPYNMENKEIIQAKRGISILSKDHNLNDPTLKMHKE